MNKRRIVVAVAGLIFLVISMIAVFSYGRGADERALKGLNPQSVLVARTVIPRGTTAEALTALVRSETLPAKAIVPSAATQLDQIAGRVANTDIQPGEQIIQERFVDPTTLGASSSVKIPKGFQQVSFTLDSQRALGGRIVAGNRVGIFISYSDNAKYTSLALNQVLVSDIRGGEAAASGDAPKSPDSSSTLSVTVAVSAADASKIVWAATNGTMWLSLEGPDADTSGVGPVSEGNVLR